MSDGPREVSVDGPASQFHGRSRWIDLDGPLHYLDFGGPADGAVIVCVHGLGGSAVNWSAIAPLLTDRYRVLAPDLAGHGLTQSRGRGTGVAANRVLLHRFIESGPGGPVILMGNSMGGMISLLEASAAPDAVAGLILIDPALPLVPSQQDPLVTAMFVLGATPGVGRVMLGRRSRVAPEVLVASTMSLVCEDASRVPADVVAQHVEMILRRAGFTDVRRGIGAITCPVLLLHGERDRVVPVAAARAIARANPSWTLVVLPGAGHVPQLEAADESAGVITEWLDAAGHPAVESATPGLGVNAPS
jgi:pimeloyl-ACP methyl ester carboxylesterase